MPVAGSCRLETRDVPKMLGKTSVIGNAGIGVESGTKHDDHMAEQSDKKEQEQ